SLRSPRSAGVTITTRSTPASSINASAFSMVNGSGICGFAPGTHLKSGASAFHRWTCESTIIRLRAACGAVCWQPCVARARPAPSALAMKWRRDAMSAGKALHRCIVVREVEVAVRGRRSSAPAAFDLGAQREHVAEAFHVEARVPGDAELRVGHELPGLRRRLGAHVQALGEDPHRRVLVGW